MKVVSIAAAGVSLVLIALTLAPSAGEYRAYFAIGALVCAAAALATIVYGWREPSAGTSVGSASERPPAGRARVETGESATAKSASNDAMPPPTVNASPSIQRAASGEAQVVAFLATLQEKGRLVDFLQDDITGYSDAQVGAAARVVHQGCKAVMNEYFQVVPVREETEGAKVTVPAGYVTDEYRLVGKISGQAPFSGTLMHRGWKAQSVRLPRFLRTAEERLPTIAPAEVELR